MELCFTDICVWISIIIHKIYLAFKHMNRLYSFFILVLVLVARCSLTPNLNLLDIIIIFLRSNLFLQFFSVVSARLSGTSISFLTLRLNLFSWLNLRDNLRKQFNLLLLSQLATALWRSHIFTIFESEYIAVILSLLLFFPWFMWTLVWWVWRWSYMRSLFCSGSTWVNYLVILAFLLWWVWGLTRVCAIRCNTYHLLLNCWQRNLFLGSLAVERLLHALTSCRLRSKLTIILVG